MKSTKLTAILVSALMAFTVMPMTGYAAAKPDPEYAFDHTKTAVSQLEDLFTTIDIMAASKANGNRYGASKIIKIRVR